MPRQGIEGAEERFPLAGLLEPRARTRVSTHPRAARENAMARGKTPFYTATGDQGWTGLLGEVRVPKDHPQIEALGALDEASAVLGLARNTASHPDIPAILARVQQDLYHLMAEVAATPEQAATFRRIDLESVAWLEEQIHRYAPDLPRLTGFILPGETLSSGFLALARTVVRRAERRVFTLMRLGLFRNPEGARYLNRLSSLCFVLELLELQAAGKMPTSVGASRDDQA